MITYLVGKYWKNNMIVKEAGCFILPLVLIMDFLLITTFMSNIISLFK